MLNTKANLKTASNDVTVKWSKESEFTRVESLVRTSRFINFHCFLPRWSMVFLRFTMYPLFICTCLFSLLTTSEMLYRKDYNTKGLCYIVSQNYKFLHFAMNLREKYIQVLYWTWGIQMLSHICRISFCYIRRSKAQMPSLYRSHDIGPIKKQI